MHDAGIVHFCELNKSCVLLQYVASFKTFPVSITVYMQKLNRNAWGFVQCDPWHRHCQDAGAKPREMCHATICGDNVVEN